MSTLSWVTVVVGVLLLLSGSVFALQGANVIGGGAMMNGNATFIYVGAVVAILGVLFIGVGASVGRSKKKPESPDSSAASRGPRDLTG